MLLGILSDTHDRAETAAEGVRLLLAAGVAFVVHCGDVGSEAVLDHLAGVPSAFVFGNTDYDRTGLRRFAEMIGVQCLGAAGTLDLDGKRVAVTHGDDGRLLSGLIEAQEHDYVLVGHTHVAGQERFGRTLLINPGALHRAKVKTVAVLDTSAGTVRWIEVQPK